MNQLQKAVRDYLTMRRGLGFKLVRHEAALREFVLFLARKRSVRITVNLALEWATQDANHEPYEWAARLSIVRGFARHWSATDPATEVPPLGLLPCRPPRAQPYFYSDQEIRTLLKAAKTRPSIDPLRPWTYHCLFGLLAVTGLRLGEATGRGRLRLSTATCCRRASTSRAVSLRLCQKTRTTASMDRINSRTNFSLVTRRHGDLPAQSGWNSTC